MKTFTPISVTITFIMILLTSIILANGLEFSLKITTPSSEVNQESFKDYAPVRIHDQFTEVGYYKDYLIAMKKSYELSDLGFTNVDIIAFFNRSPITIEDAFELLNNRNKQEFAVNPAAQITEQEMETAIASVRNENFYYTIQLHISDKKAVEGFFDFPKQIDESITDQGAYRYSFGKFYTLQDAKDALSMVKHYNLDESKVIAFDDFTRISLDVAMEKEKRKLEYSLAQLDN